MDLNTLPSPSESAPESAPGLGPEPAAESFSGWLVSSVELLCGLTVTQLAIDATQPGWRDLFGLPAP